MRHKFLSLLLGGIALLTASSITASSHSSIAVAAPKTSPLPGAVPRKSAAVANLVASVHQRAAATAAVAARMELKRTGATGVLIFKPGDSVEVAMLRRVYGLLSVANNDNKGEIKRAMVDVAAAGRHLKSHLSPDPGEKRMVSESQLREAQRMLSQVGASAAARRTQKAVGHIQSAINHLNIALASN